MDSDGWLCRTSAFAREGTPKHGALSQFQRFGDLDFGVATEVAHLDDLRQMGLGLGQDIQGLVNAQYVLIVAIDIVQQLRGQGEKLGTSAPPLGLSLAYRIEW